MPRFASFDLAGNFSGWVEGEPAKLPRNGCSLTDEPAPGWLVHGLLAVILRRRRQS